MNSRNYIPNKKQISRKEVSCKNNKQKPEIQKTLAYNFKKPKLKLNELDGYQYIKNPDSTQNQILNSVFGKKENLQEIPISNISPSNIKSINFENDSINSIKKMSTIKRKGTNVSPIQEFNEYSNQTFKSDFEESFFSGSNLETLPKSPSSLETSKIKKKSKKKGVSFHSQAQSERQRESLGMINEEPPLSRHDSQNLSVFGHKKIKCFLCGKMIVTKTANSHVRVCKLRHRSSKKKFNQSRIQKVASSEFIERYCFKKIMFHLYTYSIVYIFYDFFVIL
jgi:hypothetical protein